MHTKKGYEMKKTVTLTAIAMLIATTGEADTDGRFKFSDLFAGGGWSSHSDDEDEDVLGGQDARDDDRGDDDDHGIDDRGGGDAGEDG
ncbi:hypothetical protein RA29_03030 [Tateyamaria sp. ANG-S1]|nr:hypothetical protein RA29_03030 [Tateyamaria sp. ANG-S1]